MTTATDAADAPPTVAMGRRFLPVAGAVWPPVVHGHGLVELPVAPGTPVHATSDGRVVEASAGIAGELVIRDVDEHLVHYRRLLPSSVRARAGDRITAGDLLGVVAVPPVRTDVPTVAFGIKSAADQWLDVTIELAGAADPDELFHPLPSVVVDPLAGAPVGRAGGAPVAPSLGTDAPAPGKVAVANATSPQPVAATRDGTGQQVRPADAARPAPARTRDRRGRRPADPKRIAAVAPPDGAPVVVPAAAAVAERPAPPPTPPAHAASAEPVTPAPPPDPAGAAGTDDSPPPQAPPALVDDAEPPARQQEAPEAQEGGSPAPPDLPAPQPAEASAEPVAPGLRDPAAPATGADEAPAEPDPAEVFRKLAGRSRRKER